ncbi:toll/interleukin-1 receptor domain-containing protein, partial [Stenotrophomonas maltophilia]
MAEDVQVGDSGDSSSMRTNNPFVFISHDTRDAELAEAFSNLLKSVSAGVLKSFRTSDRRGNQGIEYGVEWYPEIIKSIQAASDVVCLLTERSVDRPWILFEAGMAKGKLDTPILGVALGIELKAASSGPFAQFQNCADDEESLTKLVFQLVNRIPGSEPDRDTIRFQVGKFKAAVDEIIGKLALPASQEKKK